MPTWEAGSIFGGYEILYRLGYGRYGTIFCARNKKDGKDYALKHVRTEDETQGIPVTTLREISTLRSLEHPNIVKFVFSFLFFSFLFTSCYSLFSTGFMM